MQVEKVESQKDQKEQTVNVSIDITADDIEKGLRNKWHIENCVLARAVRRSGLSDAVGYSGFYVFNIDRKKHQHKIIEFPPDVKRRYDNDFAEGPFTFYVDVPVWAVADA